MSTARPLSIGFPSFRGFHSSESAILTRLSCHFIAVTSSSCLLIRPFQQPFGRILNAHSLWYHDTKWRHLLALIASHYIKTSEYLHYCHVQNGSELKVRQFGGTNNSIRMKSCVYFSYLYEFTIFMVPNILKNIISNVEDEVNVQNDRICSTLKLYFICLYTVGKMYQI